MRNDNMPKPWPPAEPCMTSAVKVLRGRLACLPRMDAADQALARLERLVEADREYELARHEYALSREARASVIGDLDKRERFLKAKRERRAALAAVLGGNKIADLSLHDKKEG